MQQGAEAKEKKSFYESAFKLPMDVTSYERLGKALAAAGRKPEALQAIVDDVVRLAAGQTADDAVTS